MNKLASKYSYYSSCIALHTTTMYILGQFSSFCRIVSFEHSQKLLKVPVKYCSTQLLHPCLEPQRIRALDFAFFYRLSSNFGTTFLSEIAWTKLLKNNPIFTLVFTSYTQPIWVLYRYWKELFFFPFNLAKHNYAEIISPFI